MDVVIQLFIHPNFYSIFLKEKNIIFIFRDNIFLSVTETIFVFRDIFQIKSLLFSHFHLELKI